MTPLLDEKVAELEQRLDPARPEESGLEVLDCGEVSVVLAHPALPGRVLKRMGGFRRGEQAQAYAGLVVRYCLELEGAGVPCLPSTPTCVPTRTGTWAVWVVQPLVPARQLGKVWLASADAAGLRHVLRQVASLSEAAMRAGAGSPGRPGCGVDAQLSNWRIVDDTVTGLLDVTTPLLRTAGRLDLDLDVVLRTFPGPLRAWLRRTRQVERIMSVHFDARANLLDVVANLHKEGRGDLVPAAVDEVNDWLAEQDPGAPLKQGEVLDYYRGNSRALSLSLRVRRLDRRGHLLLRRPYPAVLPRQVNRAG